MNRFLYSQILLFLSLIIFGACTANETAVAEEMISEVDNTKVIFDKNYQIVVPSYFQEMYDINPKAIVQYGYINKEKDSSSHNFEDEFYTTVLRLDKRELAPSFLDSGRITLNKVNDRTAMNLELILEDFLVVNKRPKPVLINGIAAIKNEFSGRLGQYKVFYKMAIYENETDFYQLLTWCMQKHSNKHKNEMEAVIQSFENI